MTRQLAVMKLRYFALAVVVAAATSGLADGQILFSENFDSLAGSLGTKRQ